MQNQSEGGNIRPERPRQMLALSFYLTSRYIDFLQSRSEAFRQRAIEATVHLQMLSTRRGAWRNGICRGQKTLDC